MEDKNIYNKFESLPFEAQRQVIAFMDFLQLKYGIKKSKKSSELDFEDEKFVGIWQSRTDLKESSTWVKTIRKNNWREVD